MDIPAWLNNLGLSQYEQAFVDNAIDADVLLNLTQDDLRDLGVMLVGHRRKLMAAIEKLRPGEAAGDNSREWPAAADRPYGVLGPAAANAERRRVTVMFYDLVGSTALSTRIDPEELRDVVGAYHRRVAEVIAGLGGFVARLMGDGGLVYFGYPEAHEDDPERAVLAALGAVEAVGELKLADGLALQMRAGIATGTVVIGDIVGNATTPEHDVAGEVVNLAARLESIADPNAIVVSAATRRLLGHLFAYRALPRLDLKGFAGPIDAYEILGPNEGRDRFDVLRATMMAPLIGRDEEYGLMLRRWERSCAGDGQIVLLAGEAGIGKSRLAATLAEQIGRAGGAVQRIFCSPHHANSALFPVIGHLEHVADLQRDDSPELKLDKIERVFPHGDSQDLALIAELISIPAGDRYPPSSLTAQKRKERTLAVLLHNQETLAKHKPVLMLVEDVHWIDPTSRELLELLIERVPRWSLLLVITFRPEFHPPWFGQPNTTSLTLSRLSGPDSAKLVAQVGGGKLLPNEVLHQILARTDGVPLFIEELTKLVLESGQLEEHETQYMRRLPPIEIPETLDASLMARLDRLAAAKPIAQMGAAIGREFSYEMLAAIAAIPEPVLRDLLARLVGGGLVFARGEPPNSVYRFKHALVRDAAYGSLLRRSRRELHLRIGETLEGQFSELVAAQPDLLAHHFTEAEAWEKAISYWEKAGRQATARSAMAEAVAHLRQALDLLQRLPDTLARQQHELALLIAFGNALIGASGYTSPETGRVYERARMLCDQLSDTANLVRVAHGLWSFYAMRAEINDASLLARELLTQAEQNSSPVLLLTAHRLLGASLLQVGRLGEARVHLETAQRMLVDAREEDLATDAKDAAVGVPAYLSVLLALLGYYEQARAHSITALREAKRSFRPHRFLFALGVAGYWFGALLRDDTMAAEEGLTSLSAEHDFPYWAVTAMQCRGVRLASEGRLQEGIAQVREGVRRQTLVGATWANPFFVGSVAQFADVEEGIELVDDATRQLSATGVRWFAPELSRIRGELLLRRGDTDLAEMHFRQAIDEARRQDARHWELRAAKSLASLWREQGKGKEARDLLAPIYTSFTEGVDILDVQQAHALLDTLESTALAEPTG